MVVYSMLILVFHLATSRHRRRIVPLCPDHYLLLTRRGRTRRRRRGWVMPGWDPGIDLMVRSLLSVDTQPYFSLAHEAFGLPHKVVLHLQLHHALDKVAAAGVVEGP